jgi:hypothetical protein
MSSSSTTTAAAGLWVDRCIITCTLLDAWMIPEQELRKIGAHAARHGRVVVQGASQSECVWALNTLSRALRAEPSGMTTELHVRARLVDDGDNARLLERLRRHSSSRPSSSLSSSASKLTGDNNTTKDAAARWRGLLCCCLPGRPSAGVDVELVVADRDDETERQAALAIVYLGPGMEFQVHESGEVAFVCSGGTDIASVWLEFQRRMQRVLSDGGA